MSKKEYYVDGDVRFAFVLDEIKAESEEEAKKIALEMIEDYYRVHSNGAYTYGAPKIRLYAEINDD